MMKTPLIAIFITHKPATGQDKKYLLLYLLSCAATRSTIRQEIIQLSLYMVHI